MLASSTSKDRESEKRFRGNPLRFSKVRNRSSAVVASYDVPGEVSVHAIRMVRAGLHGFADIEARGGFQMPEAVDQSFLVLIDALDTSLENLGRHTRYSSRIRNGRSAVAHEVSK